MTSGSMEVLLAPILLGIVALIAGRMEVRRVRRKKLERQEGRPTGIISRISRLVVSAGPAKGFLSFSISRDRTVIDGAKQMLHSIEREINQRPDDSELQHARKELGDALASGQGAVILTAMITHCPKVPDEMIPFAHSLYFQSSATSDATETLKLITAFCCGGLLVSLLLAIYGLDLRPF